MNETVGDGIPERAYRLLFFGIVLYFALLAYSVIGDAPIAAAVATILFGVIAIGMGVVLYQQSNGEPSAVLAAAVCLAVGGLLQFAFLATGLRAIDDLASIAVFAGVGLYLYTVWGDS